MIKTEEEAKRLSEETAEFHSKNIISLIEKILNEGAGIETTKYFSKFCMEGLRVTVREFRFDIFYHAEDAAIDVDVFCKDRKISCRSASIGLISMKSIFEMLEMIIKVYRARSAVVLTRKQFEAMVVAGSIAKDDFVINANPPSNRASSKLDS